MTAFVMSTETNPSQSLTSSPLAPDKGEILERFSFSNTTGDMRDVVVGMFGGIASYEGWNSLNIVAGEIDTPHRY